VLVHRDLRLENQRARKLLFELLSCLPDFDSNNRFLLMTV
jgi:hypothetical protein